MLIEEKQLITAKERDLNVALICQYHFPYGMAATNRIIAYAKGLIVLGSYFKVYIYRPTDKIPQVVNVEPIGNYKGINYEYTYGRTIRSTNKFLHLLEIIWGLLRSIYLLIKDDRNTNYDIVIISHDSPEVLLLFNSLAKILKIKSVFIFDEYPPPIRTQLRKDIPGWKKYLYKVILSRYDGFISMTDSLLNFYINIVRKDIKSFKLPVLVEIDRFDIQPDDQKGIKLLNKVSNYICYMGNLDLKKDNVDIIIKAFSIITDDFPDLKLLIGGVGKGNDLVSLKDLTLKLRIDDKTLFLGEVHREDVPIFLRKAKILVNSQPDTRRADGGFPTKLGEYLASGIPVVLTDVGEISKFVHDRNEVFFVKPNDEIDFAEKMSFVLNNPENCQRSCQ